MIKKNYLIGSKNEAFGPGGIQNAITETLVRTEGPIDAKLIDKSINENGTYSASAEGADGFKKVTVDVPNTYFLSDEGKVVSGGSLVTQTSSSITQNGIVDTTLIDSVTVDVSGSSGGGGFSTNESLFTTFNDIIVDLTMPSNITTIYEEAFFDNAEYLETVNMPNVTSVEYTAFCSSPSLKTVNMPEVIEIQREAFMNCPSLENVSMPKVITIEYNAFAGCSVLSSITIPSTTTSIGEDAFADCDNLTTITVEQERGSSSLASTAPWGAPSTTQVIWANE